MLKALQLVGFKSFADKTRFDFPAGITVVVGPNGSGKSNIVDAIKWVLGEQSAKSLRGKDMADVIFKGSSASGRRPMNTAEATIIIDNSGRLLDVDAPEVHVTRRVYRSGEGEYLINGEPTRLRDIKDLFRGTGVGTDAYSLIEQGKVDKLVDATPKDRRAIFEEAAGISRFKAKKIETERRLERVEQNLLRLSDIVEEVDSRLRTVRNQAAKARRYQEYTERLMQLRTQVGLVDWRKLSKELTAVETEISHMELSAGEALSQAECTEARALELDVAATAASERMRTADARAAQCRARIAADETTIAHGTKTMGELEGEVRRRRSQQLALMRRAIDQHQLIADSAAELAESRRRQEEVAGRAARGEAAAQESAREIESLRRANEERRTAYLAALRESAAAGNRLDALQRRAAGIESSRADGASRLAETAVQSAAVDEELSRRRSEQQQLAAELAESEDAQEALQSVLLDSRRWLARRQEQLVELQGRLSGARQRVDVLEELERNREGLGAGARDLLDRRSRTRQDSNAASHSALPDSAENGQNEENPFDDVVALVADLIEADVEHASLVDAALGETARHVVVDGDRLSWAIERGEYLPPGRVALLPLEGPAVSRVAARANLTSAEGVIGRADRLVKVAPRFAALVERLLATTWFVDDLAAARRLARRQAHLRFVTRGGVVMEADGTLVAGSPQTESGLIARRSRLAALRVEIAEMEREGEHYRRETSELTETVDRHERRLSELADRQRKLHDALAENRLAAHSLDERAAALKELHGKISEELERSLSEQAQTADALQSAESERAAAEQRAAELESGIRAAESTIAEREEGRAEQQRELTAVKIELARCEQRVETLQTELDRYRQDCRERDRSLETAAKALADCRSRLEETVLGVLRSSAAVAELQLAKEALLRESAAQLNRRKALLAERSELSETAQTLRRRLRKLEERLSERKLAAGDVHHRRDSLADRLREDYGIELADLVHPPAEEEPQARDEVEEEIAALRRRINNIGAVNLEALEELEDLEARFGSLSSQHRDILQSKQHLERTIQKINADSRRLFTETLEAIRVNFQALYRKLFGGGRADIVLEENVDLLEAGVEILSNPPGKPQFSNSLLSGGEKALTALALLLAIFQHKPSPFCILDEVDAPWDEANIGRFIDVLNGFLTWTRFVIVTHSKKTMTAATTLYGVTMQESGVSKRVSVRFEDVTHDGHIRSEALQRQENQADDEAA